MIDRKQKRTGEFLSKFNGPCPYCGYQLKNPSSERCPECGSRLVVGVFSPFRFSPWHALVVSTAITIGVCFDRLFLVVVGMFNSNAGFVVSNLFYLFALFFIVLCGVFYVVWRCKKKFDKLVLWKRVFWYCVSILVPIVVTLTQYYLLMRVLVWS
jgi:rRNA maturation protein Nop10